MRMKNINENKTITTNVQMFMRDCGNVCSKCMRKYMRLMLLKCSCNVWKSLTKMSRNIEKEKNIWYDFTRVAKSTSESAHAFWWALGSTVRPHARLEEAPRNITKASWEDCKWCWYQCGWAQKYIISTLGNRWNPSGMVTPPWSIQCLQETPPKGCGSISKVVPRVALFVCSFAASSRYRHHTKVCSGCFC